MKLSFVARKVGGKLVPVDLHAEEELSRLKEGEEVYVEARNSIPPTLRQMRTIWWLASKLAENDPHGRFPRNKALGKRKAMEYFMVICRFAETRISAATGSTIISPKSPDELKKDEMIALVDCAMEAIEGDLGVAHPDLVRELTEAIGASH